MSVILCNRDDKSKWLVAWKTDYFEYGTCLIFVSDMWQTGSIAGISWQYISSDCGDYAYA